MHGGELWRRHPHVRSGDELTFGERAADVLKARFGSWPFLIWLNTLFCIEVIIHIATRGRWDPGLLYLNLFLSWLAAQQGGALQIAANRSDRIAAEVATGTAANTKELVAMNIKIISAQERELAILEELRAVRRELAAVSNTAPMAEVSERNSTCDR